MNFKEKYRAENRNQKLDENRISHLAEQMADAADGQGENRHSYLVEPAPTGRQRLISAFGVLGAAAATAIGMLIVLPQLQQDPSTIAQSPVQDSQTTSGSSAQPEQEAVSVQTASQGTDIAVCSDYPVYTLDELNEKADLIVYAQVAEIAVSTNLPDTDVPDALYAVYRLSVSEQLKGDCAEEIELAYFYHDFQQFGALPVETDGQDYLFYLYHEGTDYYTLVSPFQGCYPVNADEPSADDPMLPNESEILVEDTLIKEDRKLRLQTLCASYAAAQANQERYENTDALSDYLNEITVYNAKLPLGAGFDRIYGSDDELLIWLIQQAPAEICREQERIAATGREIAFVGGTVDWLETTLQKSVSPEIRLPADADYDAIAAACVAVCYDGNQLHEGTQLPYSSNPKYEAVTCGSALYYAVCGAYEYEGRIYAEAYEYYLTDSGQVQRGDTGDVLGSYTVLADGSVSMTVDTVIPPLSVFVLEENADSVYGYSLISRIE